MSVTSPHSCPICGADVPRGARACPECGADERTGWDDERTRYDGLDLPEHAFEEEDDDEARKRRMVAEFSARRSTGRWRLVALGLLGIMILLAVLGS